MYSSEQIDQIAEALVKFQAEVGAVVKRSEADAGKYVYHYADLATVHAAIRPALHTAGLAVVQTFVPAQEPGGPDWQKLQHFCRLRTQLMHRSGQWIASEIPIVAPWGDPRALGSAITYVRRYALLAILSLAAEDDDGLEVEQARSTAQARRPASAVAQNGGVSGTAAGGRRSPERDERPAEETGRQLYDWACTAGELEWFKQYARQREWPSRLVEWSPAQVQAAMRAYEVARARAQGVRSGT